MNNLSNQLNIEPPMMAFMEIRHDDYCLAIDTQSVKDCTCKNSRAVFMSEGEWKKGVVQSRQARRAAERKAAKAMRKAAGK